MDSPRQELSNSGLGIVLVISVFRQSIFVCVYRGSNPAVVAKDIRILALTMYVFMYICTLVSSGCWTTIIVSQCVSLPAEQPLRVPVHASCCRQSILCRRNQFVQLVPFDHDHFFTHNHTYLLENVLVCQGNSFPRTALVYIHVCYFTLKDLK